MAGYDTVDHTNDHVDIVLLGVPIPRTSVSPLFRVQKKIFVQNKIA